MSEPEPKRIADGLVTVALRGPDGRPCVETKTTRDLVVVTAPGPGSGKLATCLSQIYHDHQHGISAGYAKFETFPIWNLPLDHPVNVAYEAATVDLDDVNMIDPFHLRAYGETLTDNEALKVIALAGANRGRPPRPAS